jgi:hypothetical protein
MPQLLNEDVAWLVRRLPKRVRDLAEDMPNRLVIAGGFIRSCIANEVVNDVDLFPHSDDIGLVIDRLTKNITEAKITTYETENAITIHGLKYPTQVITRWKYDKPADVVLSFDFTIAQSAIWFAGSQWSSLCHENFYADLAAKRLKYTSPQRDEEPGGSMLRVLKFYQRGYRIPLEDLAKVISRMTVGIHDQTALPHEQIVYGLLRDVDPLVDPSHLMH